MEKSYKIRIYPNEQQRILIHKTFGCCRFVYNYYLELRTKKYQETKKNFSGYDCIRDLTKLKNDYPWLKEPDKWALQNAIKDLDYAFMYFLTKPETKYPKFKSKNNHRLSYRTQNGNYNRSKPVIRFLDANHIVIPKIGALKIKDSRVIEGKILSATISQVPSGKYFISLCCTDIESEQLSETNSAIGVDLGIHELCVDSNGKHYPNPRYLRKSQDKINKLQKELARRKKGGANWNKTRIKLAKAYEKIANQRKDNIQKITTSLIKSNAIVCIEDLSVSNTIREVNNMSCSVKAKRQIINSISDSLWYEFRRELEYKVIFYNRELVIVDKYFSSSQNCHICGYRNHEVKRNLSKRLWICPQCGYYHDRDENAAINILNEGLKQRIA